MLKFQTFEDTVTFIKAIGITLEDNSAQKLNRKNFDDYIGSFKNFK